MGSHEVGSKRLLAAATLHDPRPTGADTRWCLDPSRSRLKRSHPIAVIGVLWMDTHREYRAPGTGRCRVVVLLGQSSRCRSEVTVVVRARRA